MRLFCALGAMIVIAAGCQAPLLVVNKTYTVNMFGAGDNDLGGVAVDKNETISPSMEAKIVGLEASASADISTDTEATK